MKTITSTFTLALVLFVNYSQAQIVTGQWLGMAFAGSEETQLALTISQIDDRLSASMSLSDIGVSGWPALSVERIGNTLHVTFPSDSGLQQMVLSVDGKSMTGTWQENRFETPAMVKLNRKEVESLTSVQQILIQGVAGNLGASLIMPVCENGCPGVVFVHGSGPQPRDTSRFAASVFAKYGIASMIYDKRGVGESEGDLEGVSFDALAADAIAVADALRQVPGVSSVGFFGHSQGGWIAPLAGSKWAGTAFIITSAGPAVPPSREAEWDVVRRLRADKLSTKIEEEARIIIQLWHRGVRSGDWSLFDRALSVAKDMPWFESAGFYEFMTRPSQAFIDNYRAFMDYDPIPALSSLVAPMLAILAPDDESIDAGETEILLRELQNEGHNIKLKIYPGYDHSMRRLGSELNPIRWPEHPDDYFSIQARFIQGALLPR